MPLEALRHEITPLGLHYLLTHYDIPDVDAASWQLGVGGRVERELELSLDDLRARETVTMPVTMECAGNGRAELEPHVVSQPWLAEAVGTAEWTGTPVGSLLAEAGLRLTRWRSCSPASTAASRAASSSCTSAACRWSTPSRACSHGDATASRCRPSTASRCAWSCPAGTG